METFISHGVYLNKGVVGAEWPPVLISKSRAIAP
jgi:hypothetical protein